MAGLGAVASEQKVAFSAGLRNTEMEFRGRGKLLVTSICVIRRMFLYLIKASMRQSEMVYFKTRLGLGLFLTLDWHGVSGPIPPGQLGRLPGRSLTMDVSVVAEFLDAHSARGDFFDYLTFFGFHSVHACKASLEAANTATTDDC